MYLQIQYSRSQCCPKSHELQPSIKANLNFTAFFLIKNLKKCITGFDSWRLRNLHLRLHCPSTFQYKLLDSPCEFVLSTVFHIPWYSPKTSPAQSYLDQIPGIALTLEQHSPQICPGSRLPLLPTIPSKLFIPRPSHRHQQPVSRRPFF